MTKLKGMTWSHPRGYDPMIACSSIWKEKTGVEIAWDKRSLQDFESFPVEELARQYDLIVIDHPHVGQITEEGCLAPLDVAGREDERRALADASVGLSYPSYNWSGRQWAFPIDAAAQVQAYRPDALAQAPQEWEEVIALAREGRMAVPLRPPHSLMCFYTLAANMGHPCRNEGDGPLIDQQIGEQVYEKVLELAALVPNHCAQADPIAILEEMAREDSRIICSPLIYGYVNYAIDGFRPRLLRFADIPVAGSAGPVGSAIGGTGIAVSAFSSAREVAIDFAYWISSADIQRGPFAQAGGQPGHAAGWEDGEVNRQTQDFYRDTRATLEGGWLRPRHNGYMTFQQEGAARLTKALSNREPAARFVADLNRMFEQHR
ncbi:Extracellular solute-binding protein family 1 [Nitratireductor basaltis]|uniref:Extracellular solute-binding protein family 1 n=1 Tax=Nitratireductor basaltis TaxID=472175 RepID=A0A084U5D0_9HYPH|nr:Extracellular solute-binding protein family 1 [Nitratireductor basaltis]